MPHKETERDRLMREAAEAAGGVYKQTGIEWFKNMFLYHYLKYIAIGAVALGIVAFFLVDIFTTKQPDFTLVIGSDAYINEVALNSLLTVIKNEIGDVNGDGEVYVDVANYVMTDVESIQAFDFNFMAVKEDVLFLLYGAMVDRYDRESSYEPLSNLGLVGTDQYTLRANDQPMLKSLLAGHEEHVFVFKAWQVDKKDDVEFINKYELATRVLRRIVSNQ